MVERQEVEVILAEVHSMAEINQVAVGDIAHPVSGDTLAALCRAWLAAQDAPTADVQWDGGAEAYLVFDGGPEEMRGCRWNAHMAEQLHGQRVRIVKEVG